jgi:hypothetical protein
MQQWPEEGGVQQFPFWVVQYVYLHWFKKLFMLHVCRQLERKMLRGGQFGWSHLRGGDLTLP